MEGTYPEDVQYLRDHYNLSYNAEKYFVAFRDKPFASNVIPDIIVEVKGADGQ